MQQQDTTPTNTNAIFGNGLDKKPFIAVVGAIGVGKSTLTDSLAEHYGVPAYKENVENELLPAFYENPAKYAFALNVSLHTERKAQRELLNSVGQGGVADKLQEEDLIFFERFLDLEWIDREQYNSFCTLVAQDMTKGRQPDVVIYLRASPEKCFERIQKRDRPMEKELTLKDMVDICARYDKWMQGKLSNAYWVITIDWNDFHSTDLIVRIIEYERTKRQYLMRALSMDVVQPMKYTPEVDKDDSTTFNLTFSERKTSGNAGWNFQIRWGTIPGNTYVIAS